MMRTCGWIAIAAFAAACASAPTRIPLTAAPSDLERLAGRWSGEYWSADRRGLIDVTVIDGETAYGDVLMIGDADNYAGLPAVDRAVGGLPMTAGRSRIVQFRRLSAIDGRIVGSLTPYWDRVRRCEARATFTGVIGRSRIDGQFLSTCPGGVPAIRGRWTVTRRDQATR
jgi:hypothetical protein